MKFLVERFLISNDDRIKYNSLTDNQKRKFIRNWIHKNGYRDYLESAEVSIIEHIIENGFNPKDNKFLTYLEYLDDSDIARGNIRVNNQEIDLIASLIDDNKLDPKEPWLYLPSLYKDDPQNVLFKVKALTYASDKDLQKGANKKLKPENLINKNGEILSVDGINQVLEKIKISEEEAKKRKESKKKSSDNKQSEKKEITDKRLIDIRDGLIGQGAKKKDADNVIFELNKTMTGDETDMDLALKALRMLGK